MSPYRSVGEEMTKFLEGLVHAAQRRRMTGPGLMGYAYAAEVKKETPAPTKLSRVLKQVQEADFVGMGLIKNGSRVLADVDPGTPDVKVFVIADDGRKASRVVTEHELMMAGDMEVAQLIGRAIRAADAELGVERTEYHGE